MVDKQLQNKILIIIEDAICRRLKNKLASKLNKHK